MDRVELLSFIKEENGAEIARLQMKFGINYKEAKEAVDKLVSDGLLVYAEGVRYNIAVKKTPPPDSEKPQPQGKPVNADGEDTDNKPNPRSLRAYFEARRKEFEAHKKEYEDRKEEEEDDDDVVDDEDDEDDDDIEDDDDDDVEETEEDCSPSETELRKKALRLCIYGGTASVSMLQRALPIGYIRACNIIDWMEEHGYISVPRSPRGRSVLITEEDYYSLYPEDRLEDITDTDDDLYTPFDDLLLDDEKANQENSEEKKPALQRLAGTFSRIAENKKAPVCADTVPDHSLWTNEEEFTNTVLERMKRLIMSDKKMGKQGAVKKAEAYLEGVRDTHDGKMVQVYERLVYEIKNTSNYLYAQLKKQFCEN